MHFPETPKANPENLLMIVREAAQAKIVLPEFQRSFVWDRGDIQELLVSVLQGYFVGTFLVLDTPVNNPMFPFRTIEGLEVVNVNARPQQHQTVRLVLDGQQRITSMFYALYAPDIPLRNSKHPYKFYLSLEPALNGNLEDSVLGISVQDRGRMTAIQEEIKNHRALPITLFRESNDFYKWLYSEQNVWDEEKLKLIGSIYNRFQNFMVPVVSLSPETGTDNIVNIFERINRTGVNLSLFDLACARLYPKGVRLRELWEAFKKKNAALVDTVSPEFILRVIALLEKQEPRKSNLLKMLDSFNSDNFVQCWERAEDVVLSAFKRIEVYYGACDKKWIPYTTLIVPLAALICQLKELKAGEESYRKVDRWYWASVFTQRYDSAVDTKSYQDVRDITSWIKGESSEPEWLNRAADEAVDLTVAEQRSAVYRGVICLVTLAGACDFLTGQRAVLNSCQDDHIFPTSVYNKNKNVDVVLNRTLISEETNNRKRNKVPSEFLRDCLAGHNGDEIRLLKTLSTHFINKDAYEALKTDNFDNFITHRQNALLKAIQAAIAGCTQNIAPPPICRTQN